MKNINWNNIKDHFSRNKENYFILLLSLFASAVLEYININYIPPDQKLMHNIINIFVSVLIIAPITTYQYGKYTRVRQYESKFPDFLRDVVEGLRGGMTLPNSIQYASKNNYGALSEPVKKLSYQLNWGIPFDRAMTLFSKQLGSKTISRAIYTIIEAHRSGGNLAEVLDAVTESTLELEKIKMERKSKIATQMMQGYVIYIIFLGVMIGMQHFLIPSLGESNNQNILPDIENGRIQAMPSSEVKVPEGVNPNPFGNTFLHLAVIQGFFAGLAIGKMAEGTINAGIKHAVILSLIGYTAMTLF